MPSFCAVNAHKSSNLQEYPHSLSYHAITLIKVLPIIIEEPTSKMDDRESPRQSDDTILSVQYPSTPFMGPSAASFIFAQTSSYVVSFSNTKVASTTDPQMVGNLKHIPFNLPFKLSITDPMAMAAPVELGMMLL